MSLLNTPTPAAPGRAQFYPLAVARIDRLCSDAAAITFEVPAELTERFRFRPGQSLTLRRVIDGHEQRRSYSICAAEGAALRIGVRVVHDGVVSGWLANEVQSGQRIEVQPPGGSFTPDMSLAGHHVLIAAGSGITPVLSIAASLLANPTVQVTVLYGNRRADSVMFADEVADLKDAHPTRFQVVHVLSREPQEVELFSGRLDDAKLRRLLPVTCDVADIDHWWLCGPYGMVTDAFAVLTELGVARERIHQELFYVEPQPPEPSRHEDPALSGAVSEVTVVLDGRSTSTAIARDTPILDGAQQVRSDLPFACRGGVCGTCRAKVTSGAVHMRRNFALEQAEIDAGFVLTCQSLPVSAKVSVDYDA